jgi:hypothetical protein
MKAVLKEAGLEMAPWQEELVRAHCDEKVPVPRARRTFAGVATEDLTNEQYAALMRESSKHAPRLISSDDILL